MDEDDNTDDRPTVIDEVCWVDEEEAPSLDDDDFRRVWLMAAREERQCTL